MQSLTRTLNLGTKKRQRISVAMIAVCLVQSALAAETPAIREMNTATAASGTASTRVSTTTGAISIPPVPTPEPFVANQTPQGMAKAVEPAKTELSSAPTNATAGTQDPASVNTSPVAANPQDAQNQLPANTQAAPAAAEPGAQILQNTTTQPTTSQDSNVLVPNGAALQSQLIPIGRDAPSTWPTLLAGFLLILGIAATGVLAVRLKQGRGLSSGRTEKQLQLLATMALSPKRQILLVKVRDRELAIASTEHGITMLSELPSHSQLTSLPGGGGEDDTRKRKNSQMMTQEEPTKLVASSTSSNQSLGEETALARSEMLMGALKNLREKTIKGKVTTASQISAETAASKPAKSMKNDTVSSTTAEKEFEKSEPTLRQTRTAFPKYLANAFEQESKRTLSQTQQQSTQEDNGNVTNLIRERLKDLRPLG